MRVYVHETMMSLEEVLLYSILIQLISKAVLYPYDLASFTSYTRLNIAVLPVAMDGMISTTVKRACGVRYLVGDKRVRQVYTCKF